MLHWAHDQGGKALTTTLTKATTTLTKAALDNRLRAGTG